MSEVITLHIPDRLARDARAVASYTHRPVEDVLLDWINRAAANPPVETLPDDQVLALCDLQLGAARQNELAELLADNRENTLNRAGQERLDELLEEYRGGTVCKAQAFKVAVERGLRPSLNSTV